MGSAARPCGVARAELLEPRRRIDRAVSAVIMTASITGTSTRKVDGLVKALRDVTDRSRTGVQLVIPGVHRGLTADVRYRVGQG